MKKGGGGGGGGEGGGRGGTEEEREGRREGDRGKDLKAVRAVCTVFQVSLYRTTGFPY